MVYFTSTDGVLYQVPPEVRKLIFCFMLEDFFEEFPERRENQLVTEVAEAAQEGDCSEGSLFAGLLDYQLPAIEQALFADAHLHGEFIATRVAHSILVLIPDIPLQEYTKIFRQISWPKMTNVPQRVRGAVRTVLFALR
jgi:hypothetical protein